MVPIHTSSATPSSNVRRVGGLEICEKVNLPMLFKAHDGLNGFVRKTCSCCLAPSLLIRTGCHGTRENIGSKILLL